MIVTVFPELREAARAICREEGFDPDEMAGNAADAKALWEGFLPHAIAAAAVFSAAFRTMAEVAGQAATATTDKGEAKRLKARGDAFHEAADMTGELRPSGIIVEFRRR